MEDDDIKITRKENVEEGNSPEKPKPAINAKLATPLKRKD
jgi:hypothetical protein